MEIWKDVIGYEGLYIISNLSNIKTIARSVNNRNNSKRFKKEITIKHSINKKGYCCVTFYKNNIRKGFRVHRLVAIHFIPNPLNLPEVNHLDGNKLNNIDTNLEWSTHLDNVKHAWENNLSKPDAVYKKVIDIETNKIYKSVREAALLNNINENTLHYYLTGKLKNKTKLKFE